MAQKIKFNKTVAKFRKEFHSNYLKLIDKVDPIKVEVVNPEMLDFLDKEYFSKGQPVNFIANHTNSHDIPVVGKAVKEHFYVVIAKEGLTLIQKIGFLLNGPIWIWRKKKESRQATQEKIILAQKNGYSTLTFFEAAWNVKENKLMNKPFNGAVNASKETNVHIVPLILIYLSGKCYVVIGKPYIVNKEKSSREQSDDLRDIMATMLHDFLEEKTDFYPAKTLKKKIEYIADNWEELPDSKMEDLLILYNQLKNLKDILRKQFKEEKEKAWEECPGLDRNFEASCIYKDGDSPDEAFAHLDRLKDNPKAKFLFKSGIKGYSYRK